MADANPFDQFDPSAPGDGNPYDQFDPSPGAGLNPMLPVIRQLEGSGSSAVSPMGARGRYQIMPATARAYGFDPDRLGDDAYSAQVASAVLDDLGSRYGRADDMFVAYNGSTRQFQRWIASGRNPAVLSQETRAYLKRGMALVGPGPTESANPYDMIEAGKTPPKPQPPAPAKPQSWWDQNVKPVIGGVQEGVASLLGGEAQREVQQEELFRAQEKAAGGFVDPTTGVFVPETPEQAAANVNAGPVKAPFQRTRQALMTSAAQNIPAHPSFLQKGEEMAGNVAPVMASGLVNPGAPVAAFFLQGYSDTYDAARKAGMSEPDARQVATLSGSIQGGLGALPFNAVGGRLLAKYGLEVGARGFIPRAANAAVSGAAQGAAIQTSENALAGQTYDPKRSLLQGVGEQALGFGAMSEVLHPVHELTGVAFGAAKQRLRPNEQPAQPAQEAQEGAPQAPASPVPETDAAAVYAARAAATDLNGQPVQVTPTEPPAQGEPVVMNHPELGPVPGEVSHTFGDGSVAVQTGQGTFKAQPSDLTVNAPQPEAPDQYEQARLAEGAPEAYMAPALNDVAEHRQAAPFGKSLFTAIKDLGGIRTVAADGQPESDVAQLLDGVRRPGLVNNKTGLTPDGLREALQERGWFGASGGDDINDLYALIDREARGTKVYHPDDANPELMDRRRALDGQLADAGVSASDPAHVAAAKLAAWRYGQDVAHTPDMLELRARADALGLEHGKISDYDELLGDVLEREAIQAEPEPLDRDEALPDAPLSPDEAAFTAAAESGLAAQPDQVAGLGDAGEPALAEPAPAEGHPQPGAGAAGHRDRAQERAEADELAQLAAGASASAAAIERLKLAGGEQVDQGFFPGAEHSARQAAQARGETLRPRVAQQGPDGLFAAPEPPQGGLFEDRVPVTPKSAEPERPKPAPSARKPKPAPEAKRLEDVGQKIGGARKDVWAQRGLNTDDLAAMTTAEAHRDVIKDHVWPKPDYRADVESGTDPLAAAMKKIIRDKLAAKPRTDSDQGRRDYIETMRTIREAMDQARTPDEVRALRDEVIHNRLGWPRGWAERPSRELSAKLFSVMKGRRDTLGIDSGDRRKAEKMVEQGFPGQIAPWTRRFDVRQDSRGAFAVYPKGSYRPLESFTDRADAEARAAALYEELKGLSGESGKLPERPHLDKLKRSGIDLRRGRDVSGEDFLKDFGFRGVEFGNWVAGDERQKAVNFAYDGLRDLADVLAVSPRALSLDGKLSLAFGARGKGRAAAHYEPERLVINLTKLSGAGSLAHEFGHALDHYFGQLDRAPTDKGAIVGASGWYDRRHSPNRNPGVLNNLRPEMADAFEKVMRSIFTRDVDRAEAVRAQELRVEKMQAALEKARATLAAETTTGTFRKQMLDYVKTLEPGLTAAGERLAALRDEKRPYTPGKTRSSYDMQAAQLSGKAGEHGYWSRPTEMFARAFESYVFDKLKTREAANDYLVQGVEPGRYASPAFKGDPYPAGLERERIDAAFDHLFDTMQEREGGSGPVLFHRPEPAAKAGPIFYSPLQRAVERSPQRQAGFDITDKMRDGAMEGQPLFRRGSGQDIGYRDRSGRIARSLTGAPPEYVDAARERLINDVGAIVRKIAPHAEARAYEFLRNPDDKGREWTVLGASWRDAGRQIIAWSLEAEDPLMIGRHEALHALKEAGLFTAKEWGALTEAARTEGWLDRYNIAVRYPDLSEDGRLEEAIAERIGDWKSDQTGQSKLLPPFVAELFRRVGQALRQVRASVVQRLGFTPSADDVRSLIGSGAIGQRAGVSGAGSGPRFARPRPYQPKTEGEEEPEPAMAEIGHNLINRALGEGVDAVGAKLVKTAGRVMPDAVQELGHDLRMNVNPMAAGSPRAQAAAKDFANALRASDYQWGRVDQFLEKSFTPEQRKTMWEALDEHGVLLRRGVEPGPGQGMNRLTPEERKVVLDLNHRADDVFASAQKMGMTDAEGLAFHAPRMVVRMGLNGPELVRSESPRKTGSAGSNLSSTTGQLKQRKHETAEETERAAQAKFGRTASVVRDIRTVGLATRRLEQAVAGRSLIEQIRNTGKQLGEAWVHEGETPDPGAFFTMDHPAMTVWRPDFMTDPETGKTVPRKDQSGNIVFKAKPLYVAKEFEGPLKAVLSRPSGPIERAVNGLKAHTVGVIMFNPLIHNAVIWGKAIPAAPRKILTFQLYFSGHAAKSDPATMSQAIHAGLVPVSRDQYRGGDLTGIAAGPQLGVGHGWGAQLVGAIPGLFDKAAGEQVKASVDKFADVWHNSFLWDRVADLQAGLYVTLRDELTKKGSDPQTAQRIAAHFANRYSGALPLEAMSKAARITANALLFSRSFTLGNLGAYKDLLTGLPSDVQAQVQRDAGLQALSHAQGVTRGKAAGMLALDVALNYVGLVLAEGAVAFIAGQAFQAPQNNEPGKENRFLIGYRPDGTAIYGRLPTGKVGEDMVRWATDPMETLKGKLSPAARLMWEIVSNDKGFGRKLYNDVDKTPLTAAKNLGRILWEGVSQLLPEGQLQGVHDLVTGETEPADAALRALLPLAGITVAKGAPGGPAVGEMYRVKDKAAFEFEQARPELQQMVRTGQLAQARQRMTGLGLAPRLQNYYVKVWKNPRLRLSSRSVADFNRTASADERAQFARFRAMEQPEQ